GATRAALQPAHRLHVLHRCLRARREPCERRPRCRSAVAAAPRGLRAGGRGWPAARAGAGAVAARRPGRARARRRLGSPAPVGGGMTSEALERTDHGPRRPAGVLSTLVWLTLVATPAAAVKLRYGNAPVDDYAFILRPTCGLVSLVSGERFAQVSGLGWVCKELELAVVPACAGINYLVVVWLTFGLGLGGKRVGLSRRLCWLPIAALAAFGLTIAVNAVRIGLSVLLRDVSLSII